jgi:hypothetical protein
MVISYDHENRNARLSLRQNEILEELANDEKLKKAGGAVPGLQNTVRYLLSILKCGLTLIVLKRIFRHFIPSMDGICWKLPLGNHTATTS